MKIKINVSINVKDIKKIKDYFLPTDQENLEFEINDPPEFNFNESSNQNNIDDNRNNSKLNADQNGYVHFSLGTVYLNPIKA